MSDTIVNSLPSRVSPSLLCQDRADREDRTHSGVCHSDLGIMENSWASLPFPTQPVSDLSKSRDMLISYVALETYLRTHAPSRNSDTDSEIS